MRKTAWSTGIFNIGTAYTLMEADEECAQQVSKPRIKILFSIMFIKESFVNVIVLNAY